MGLRRLSARLPFDLEGLWIRMPVVLALACGSVFSAFSGQLVTSPPIEGFVHEVYGIEDGMPRAGVVQSLQTRDGYLWLATFDGLVRFDGVRFEVFDSEKTPVLGSNRFVDLVETDDGSLWIRSEQGDLIRFADGVFTACGPPVDGEAQCGLEYAGSHEYSAIHEGRDGSLWVGGERGIFRFDYDRELLVKDRSFSTDSGIISILVDRSGHLWMTTRSRLWTGMAERIRVGEFEPGVGEFEFSSLAEDSEGGIWMAGATGVSRFFAGQVVPIFEHTPGLVGGDARGTIWIQVKDQLYSWRNGELERLATGRSPLQISSRNVAIAVDGSTWLGWERTLFRDEKIQLQLPTAGPSIASVAIDGAGTVWVTTNHSGELHALHPATVATVLPNEADSVTYVVYEDLDGAILAGGAFLARSDTQGDFNTISMPPTGDSRSKVSAIMRDRSGLLWIGTGRGLYTLESGGYQGPHGPPSLHGAEILALTETRGGSLWIGTDRSLFKRRTPMASDDDSSRSVDEQWVRLTGETGRIKAHIRVIRELPDGSIWLGSNGSGVIRFQDDIFTIIDTSRGLSSDLVRAIWPGPDGNLWIATENRGLNRLDPRTVDDLAGPTIEVVSKAQGLYSSGVHQIVDDRLGNLWMSSNNGIFRARLQDLEAVANGVLENLDCIAYTERDGMMNREANGGVQQAGLRDRNGQIWFPTMNGLVVVDPKSLGSAVPPKVYIEGLRIGEQAFSFAPNTLPELFSDQRSFEVVYASPSFRRPDRIRFKYRLEPYQEDWIDASDRHSAHFTKVPPGRYTFNVIASNDGVLADEAASIELLIVPRFFETTLFFGICSFVAVLAFGLSLRWREAQQIAKQHAHRLELEYQVAERTSTIARQAEKLRKLDQLKSEFFANISHELRTPLTLVIGPLEDAVNGDFGALEDPLASQIGMAAKNSRHLLSLVNQLLDIAKIEAGRYEINRRPQNLSGLLQERVEAFVALAERRQVSLTTTIPAQSIAVSCDPTEIAKVFDNLLSNALKATPSGGEVNAVCHVSQSDEVIVDVIDSGPGIPEDQLGRIFERFYQTPASVSLSKQATQASTGLGLALARQLVELHGGSIEAENIEGRGARLRVILRDRIQMVPTTSLAPAEAIDRSAKLPRENEDLDTIISSGGQDRRAVVLIVDDNLDIRSYLRRHLEGSFRVIEASNGLAALERARETKPDLVVSDVMMPGMDGTALFRELRKDPDLASIPVILVTAKASARSKLEGLLDGVDDYLVKPFDPHELKARVANLITTRRALLATPRGLEVSKIEASSADRGFLQHVQDEIEKRLDDSDLTVDQLASAVGCDRSHLLRRLRALIDETPSGLIRSLRLQRAAQLLDARSATVSEIASTVGFRSVAHFSNAFLKRYGERPSAFVSRLRSVEPDSTQLPV